MGKILAIDPGNEESAYAVYKDGKFVEYAKIKNETMLHIVIQFDADYIFIERIECFGMAVGKSVFETCIFIGRLIERVIDRTNSKVFTIGRRNVKMHMCGSMKAKDANIRQSVMDRFGSTRENAIGTKKNQGPLYGASKDIWSAMAIAITANESSEGLIEYAKPR